MHTTFCALPLILLAVPAYAETRSAHAHQHGASHLSIAIDGTNLAMVLEAPGHDILGFEAPPDDDVEAARLHLALERLSDPLGLFGLQPGCHVTSANVEAIGYDEKTLAPEGHAEFEARYEITCDSAPLGLKVTYFTAFEGSESLDVDIVTETGAAAVELTAAKPDLTFPAQ